MATNDFKPFATGAGANVLSQADWAALPALLSGFSSGKASSAQVNKAIRQASTIGALVGQFIANAGVDALDNGDVNGLVTKFTNALITNLRLGAGAPAIGVPFFWPSAAMPNTVMPEWSDMVFLKFNGATFSATTYPKLALAIPGLTLTDARGGFPRIWDDGRGVDAGRALLSEQSHGMPSTTGQLNGVFAVPQTNGIGIVSATKSINTSTLASTAGTGSVFDYTFNVSQGTPVSPEIRPRNIAFNLLVRAK